MIDHTKLCSLHLFALLSCRDEPAVARPQNYCGECPLTFLTRCFFEVSAEVLHSLQEDLLLGPPALGHQVDVVLNLAPVMPLYTVLCQYTVIDHTAIRIDCNPH